MSSIILAPIRLLGWAAAGMAFAAGWKLGSYVGELATGEKKLEWPDSGILTRREEPEPLWKRKFSRISVE